MHQQEKVFTQRQGEYEYQVHALKAEVEALKVENGDFKGAMGRMKEELTGMERARDSFKQ